MPRLLLDSHEFFSRRSEQVRKLIRRISSDPKRLHIQVQRHELGQIISASDSFNSNMPPKEMLFRTVSDKLFGQYYEIWRSNDQGRNYHLYQNYFHLYALPSKLTRDQLFCLHTEPEEPLTPMLSRVKATPHIHVVAHEERLAPVSKAHLPVCYSITEAVLSSLAEFDKHFTEALDVVQHEVISRFA